MTNIADTRLTVKFPRYDVFSLVDDTDNLRFDLVEGRTRFSLFTPRPKNAPNISQAAIAFFANAPDDGYSYNRKTLITVELPSSLKTTVALSDRRQTKPYAFYMHLPKSTKSVRMEEFNWIQSSDNKTRREIGENSNGFVLVHNPGVGDQGPRRSNISNPSDWETSDGKEVLAVWGTTINPSGIPRYKRPFTFRLCGSAAAGKLGDNFSIVALMSALQIWEWIG